MKLGYAQEIITPTIGMELIGFIPSRLNTGIEKDLQVKVLTIVNDDQYYGWLVADLLGLDIFFKETLLNKLKSNNIDLSDLQIFTTHTHSGPLCLNEKQYNSNETDKKEKDYFDYIVEQSASALIKGIEAAKNFTYKIARSKMQDFQTNRQDENKYYDNDILGIEVTFDDKEKILIYSFGGHPTILNRESTLISPDYVGEVSKILSKDYPFNIFFNAPCGDMSTRFTRKGSSLEELKRLAAVAANHVTLLTSKFGESKTMKNYSVRHLTYPLQYKEFDSVDVAQKKYNNALKAFDKAKTDNENPQKQRVLQSVAEGSMINLMQSKQGHFKKQYDANIYIVDVDDYQIINLPSEIFSSLVKPLKADNKTWVISLSDQYKTYLCDIDAFENNSYEALSSLYKKGEAEKMIEYILKAK